MGVYLAKPRTEKESEDGGSGKTSFGVTAMQGWRQAMEDAHLAIPNFEDELAVYGVFDGHGGAAVSQWVVRNFEGIFREALRAMRQRATDGELSSPAGFTPEATVLCEALQKTFLDLDVAMQTADARAELAKIHAETESKRQSIQAESNQSAEDGKTQTQMLLQALFQHKAGSEGGNAAKPLLRIIESDGQHWVQLMTDEEDDGDDDEVMHDDDDDVHEAIDDGDRPYHNKPRIEEIVDDEEDAPKEVQEVASARPKGSEGEEAALRPDAPVEAASTTSSDGGAALPADNLVAGEESPPTPASPEAASAARKGTMTSTESKAPPPSDDGVTTPESPSDHDDDKAFDSEMDSYEMMHQFDDSGKGETEEEVEKMEPQNPECCGSTAVVVVVVGGKNPMLIGANAGDSRAVLCRNGRAVPLTEDHKPQLAHEADRILKAGGAVVNGRVDGNLNLSRSLGDLYYKRDTSIPPEAQRITAFPDLRVVPLTQEDEFVLIACDGIWDCMDNQQAICFMNSRRNGVPLPDIGSQGDVPASGTDLPEKHSQICEEICDRCLSENPVQSEGIGCDNMTVMVLDLMKLASGAAAAVPPSDKEVVLYPSTITPDPSERQREPEAGTCEEVTD